MIKYLTEYRSQKLNEIVLDKIKKISRKPVSLMEVCGTHTVSIFKFGIRKILPENIKLISGPGCPVCVTSQEDIDKMIELSTKEDVIITTFGDMMKVPGTHSSLSQQKSKGSDIRIVYSVLDALEIARENNNKKVVFLAVGFETTAPTIASSILTAEKENLKNYFVLCSHKLIPPALKALVDTENLKIDGFILPGHVSTIIGSSPYEFIADEYKIPAVIAGFEPLDILQAIYFLVKMIEEEKPQIRIQYKRAVKKEGNFKARKIMEEVFETSESIWRGIGKIPESGLKLREKYRKFDIENFFNLKPDFTSEEAKGCRCGEILKGIKTPPECGLFGKKCTPEHPVGPCMVSSEGTCSAYYKYGGR